MDVTASRTLTVVQRVKDATTPISADDEDERWLPSFSSRSKQNRKGSTDSASTTATRPRPSSNRTAVWVSKSCNLAYCIGRPRHFNRNECCPFLWLSSAYEALGKTAVNGDRPWDSPDSVVWDDSSGSDEIGSRRNTLTNVSFLYSIDGSNCGGCSADYHQESYVEDGYHREGSDYDRLEHPTLAVQTSLRYEKDTIVNHEGGEDSPAREVIVFESASPTIVESLSKQSDRQCHLAKTLFSSPVNAVNI